MKNLIVVVLFTGVVIGGAVLMTSGESGDASSTDEVEKSGYGTGEESHDPPSNEAEIKKPEISESGPWPKIVVDRKRFEFGSMLLGEKKSHVFTIRNEGDADLELVEGKPTCKCTQFRLSKHTVAPGESSDLTVEWHGKLVDQNFQHGGSVYSNDPNNPETRFAVAGIVDEAIQMLPAGVWYVNAESGNETGEAEASLISRVIEDLQIKSIEPESPYLEVTSEKMSAERIENLSVRPGVISGQVIRLALKPETPPGTFHSRIVIGIEGVEDSVTVNVAATKQGPVKILAPPGVMWNEEKSGLGLGRFPKEKGREVSLNLLVDHSDFDEPLKLENIDATPSFVEAELDDGVDIGPMRRRYKLTIRIPAGIPAIARSARQPGVLKISTNHPSGQIFNILLSFTAF